MPELVEMKYRGARLTITPDREIREQLSDVMRRRSILLRKIELFDEVRNDPFLRLIQHVTARLTACSRRQQRARVLVLYESGNKGRCPKRS